MVLELSVFHIAILLGAAVLLMIAAVSDAQRYRIPNVVCAALLLLFPLFVITAPGAIEWGQHLMVFGLMLISGFVMFMGNIAGAGDIKLLAATGLWAGPHLVAVFLVTTAIAGGLLALLMALLTHLRNRSAASGRSVGKSSHTLRDRNFRGRSHDQVPSVPTNTVSGLRSRRHAQTQTHFAFCRARDCRRNHVSCAVDDGAAKYNGDGAGRMHRQVKYWQQPVICRSAL